MVNHEGKANRRFQRAAQVQSMLRVKQPFVLPMNEISETATSCRVRPASAWAGLANGAWRCYAWIDNAVDSYAFMRDTFN
jgi:hypothetical protein